jgi:PAS domain S-box-containing protein
MNTFTYLTPITYWILIVLWSFVLVFYITKLRSTFVKDRLIFVLIIILAIDAFRTLFESLYFGAWYTALAGFLPKEVHTFLIRPEMVFIPKLLNVIAAITVIVILIFKWLPKESSEKEILKDLVKKRTDEITKTNEKLINEIEDHKITTKNLTIKTTELSETIIQLKKEVIDRIQAEKEAGEKEKFLRTIYNAAENVAFIVTDFAGRDTKIMDISPGGEKIFQCKRDEVIGNKVAIFHLPEDVEEFPQMQAELLKNKKGHSGEKTLIRKTGEHFPAMFTIYPKFGSSGNLEGTIGVSIDITDRKNMEKQLIQVQKLEAIGSLAGGIAHDFNNILSPIIGYTEILLEDSSDDSPFQESLNEIYSGALRAKDLVKQILSLSRSDLSEMNPIKIQPVIDEALKLIRATVPATICIDQDIDPDCGLIKADPIKIHQIVMNISINAFHAMEESGGILKVSLNKVLFDQVEQNHDLISEDYICLTFSDTGKGMTKEVKENIFKPFFTTKEKGKGTGMGLSLVSGIVRDMGGVIDVSSRCGNGTRFNVYLPIEKNSCEKHMEESDISNPGGTERILLIDDEAVIVKIIKQMLERMGYQVYSCTSSIEALEIFKNKPDIFDLIITDLAMPNMSGDKLSTELLKIHPGIPIILCTGFSDKIDDDRALSLGIKGLLMKPIVKSKLTQKIRTVLDSTETKMRNEIFL